MFFSTIIIDKSSSNFYSRNFFFLNFNLYAIIFKQFICICVGESQLPTVALSVPNWWLIEVQHPGPTSPVRRIMIPNLKMKENKKKKFHAIHNNISEFSAFFFFSLFILFNFLFFYSWSCESNRFATTRLQASQDNNKGERIHILTPLFFPFFFFTYTGTGWNFAVFV